MNIEKDTSSPTETTATVFIDDDELMRTAWLYVAEKANKKISIYASFEDFIQESHKFHKNTTIYIDSDLGNNVKGELCAKKLFKQGFTEIYLATGYPKSHYKPMPWIKDIIGKKPPF